MPFDESLTRLDRDQCMSLLASTSFARVGISVQALPAILPVTIALMDDAVVFATVPGTKLAYATSRSILAIEADQYDTSLRQGWSVLVRGVATQLAVERDIERARALLAVSWIDGAEEHFVGVSCDLVTGRLLGGRTTSAHAR